LAHAAEVQLGVFLQALNSTWLLIDLARQNSAHQVGHKGRRAYGMFSFGMIFLSEKRSESGRGPGLIMHLVVF
jgi:hypothetical protein